MRNDLYPQINIETKFGKDRVIINNKIYLATYLRKIVFINNLIKLVEVKVKIFS